tara:strand:+ start:812 stop:1363 length:552 start_codon:yes stop_codon:yes gene_type:complete
MKIHPNAIRHETFNLVGNKKSHLILTSGYLLYARLSSTSGNLIATLYNNAIEGGNLKSPITRLSTSDGSLISERNPDAPHIYCPKGVFVDTFASGDSQTALLEISYVNTSDYIDAYPDITRNNQEAWKNSVGKEDVAFGKGLQQSTRDPWQEGFITANVRLIEAEGKTIGYRITETTHMRITE